VADLLGFTTQKRLRVEWIGFYDNAAKKNISLTAKHFGTSGETFHRWFKRLKDSKYNVKSLPD
jgi:hypothetical protein